MERRRDGVSVKGGVRITEMIDVAVCHGEPSGLIMGSMRTGWGTSHTMQGSGPALSKDRQYKGTDGTEDRDGSGA